MENYRLALWASLVFILFLIYQAWMQDYGPQRQAQATAQTQTQTSVPKAPAETPLPAVADKTAGLPGLSAVEPGGEPIRVETDRLKVEISPRGGTLEALWLLDYPVHRNQPDIKLQLFKQAEPNLYLAQSGLLGASKELAPTHEALFTSAAKDYRLAKDQNQLVVELTWSNQAGVQVVKRYRFQRGSYLIEVDHELVNQSGQEWSGRAYYQLQRSPLVDPNASSLLPTFTGAAYYSPETKYQKLPFDGFDKAKLDRDLTGVWTAMIQHYFVAAWLPPAQQTQHIFANSLTGPRYLIGGYTPPAQVAPGGSYTFTNRLFVGPKLQNELDSLAPGLALTVDYGWLTIFAQPIWWVLDHLHSLFGNWGWAIIFLTILIKAAFYKLSETSYKSMANMRKVTPRMQALKDRYGDDKERLNQAMMELYKKEKINPLGGCLPIVVQIPVFIALYWVLLESVEMRQAPFLLWINNLSEPDPYYVLPLIMGVSMFAQQKLNPAPVDPVQAKVLMSMPFVFTIFFAFFPSGLVLYWTVNNLLSIAQQWHITRKIEGTAAKT